ncbi:MAG: YggS family pyridoxal phosphate-dependent enzyme [Arenicella sp.]
MNSLIIDTTNLDKVLKKIATAVQHYNRDAGSVRLIGASKTRDASVIRAFHEAGLTDFGENYLDEALKKQTLLGDLDIQWHFIGHIQSNKTKLIAQHFHWVHSVDRLKIAQRLNTHKEELNNSTLASQLNILLQVNLDHEQSKSGVRPEELLTLAENVSKLSNIKLRGLMAIPKPRKQFEEQQNCVTRLVTLQQELNQKLGLSLDTLSVGMSNDLEAAISAGSTMVRIGTDLFGQRN